MQGRSSRPQHLVESYARRNSAVLGPGRIGIAEQLTSPTASIHQCSNTLRPDTSRYKLRVGIRRPGFARLIRSGTSLTARLLSPGLPAPGKSRDNVAMAESGSATGRAAKPKCAGFSLATRSYAMCSDTFARARPGICALVLGWLAAVATQSNGHPLSLQECFEGGDFIAHAAQARDNGMTKAAFNNKLLADIYLIQAFPRELRWFVQDPEDAEFLLAEATLVFDRPQVPEAHRSEFLSRCFDHKLGTGDSSPIEHSEAPSRHPVEPDSEQSR